MTVADNILVGIVQRRFKNSITSLVWSFTRSKQSLPVPSLFRPCSSKLRPSTKSPQDLLRSSFPSKERSRNFSPLSIILPSLALWKTWVISSCVILDILHWWDIRPHTHTHTRFMNVVRVAIYKMWKWKRERVQAQLAWEFHSKKNWNLPAICIRKLETTRSKLKIHHVTFHDTPSPHIL